MFRCEIKNICTIESWKNECIYILLHWENNVPNVPTLGEKEKVFKVV